MASARGIISALHSSSSGDSGSTNLPDSVKAVMLPALRDLVKLSNNESRGRIDPKWRLTQVVGNMRVFRKVTQADGGKAMYSYRAMLVIDAPPATVSEVIMSASLSKRWMPGVHEFRVLKPLDHNTDVVYQSVPGRRVRDLWSTRRSPAQLAGSLMSLVLWALGLLYLFSGDLKGAVSRILMSFFVFLTTSERLVVWPRDYCFLRHRHVISDSRIVIALRSISDEGAPLRSRWSKVRGQLVGGGYILEGLPRGKTRVSFISSADFGGWASVYGAHGMHRERFAMLTGLCNFMETEYVVLPSARLSPDHHEMGASSPSPSPSVFRNMQARPLPPTSLTSELSSTPSFAGAFSPPAEPQQPTQKEPLERAFSPTQHFTSLSDEEGDSSVNYVRLADMQSSYDIIRYEYPVPPKYATESEQSVSDLLKLSDDSYGDWKFLQQNNGIKIFQQRADHGVSTVKGVGTVGAPPGRVMAFLADLSKKQVYDTMFKDGRVVEKLNQFVQVNYQCFHAIFPTSGRDFCMLITMRRMPDGSYVQAAVSVDHPDAPPVSGLVRGTMHVGGFLLKADPFDEERCEVTYVMRANLGGSIPGFVMSTVAKGQPMVIAGVRDYFAKQVASLTSSDPLEPLFEPFKKHSASSSIPRSSSPMPLRKSRKNSASLTFQYDESTTSEAPTLEAPDLEGTMQKVASSPRNPKPPPTSYSELTLAAAHDLLTLAQDVSDSHWTTLGERHGVVGMSRAMPDSPIRCFKGFGVVNREAHVIKDCVMDASAQVAYDTMLHSSKVLEVYECPQGVLALCHRYYSTKHCLVKASRDFVYVQLTRKLKDGTWIVVAKSVDRPDVKPVPGSTRGTIEASGWVIQPRATDPSTSMVTYLAQVDLVKLPAAVVEVVSSKQPYLISYLREHLTGNRD